VGAQCAGGKENRPIFRVSRDCVGQTLLGVMYIRNQSAGDVPGNEPPKVMAQEVLHGLNANVLMDSPHRESARPRLRVLARRILRKYGFPPDFEDTAVRDGPAQVGALLTRAGTRWARTVVVTGRRRGWHEAGQIKKKAAQPVAAEQLF
jgi:hypothetical protein